MDESSSNTQDDSTSVPAEVEASRRQEKEVQQREAKTKEEHVESDISHQVALSKEQGSTTGKESTEARKKIFISFSFTVKKEVTEIKDKIEEQIGKDSCWICTTGVGGGDTLNGEIVKAIHDADIMLCMINKGYVNSKICEQEVALGGNLKKKMIPILLEKLEWPLMKSRNEPSPMALPFADLLYINLHDEKEKDDVFRNLIEMIREKLQIPGPRPTKPEDYIKNAVVNESSLRNLSGLLTSEWKVLGTELGLTAAQLYNIGRNHQGEEKEIIYQMLLFWKKAKGREATFDHILGKLGKVGRADLVDPEKLEEKWINI